MNSVIRVQEKAVRVLTIGAGKYGRVRFEIRAGVLTCSNWDVAIIGVQFEVMPGFDGTPVELDANVQYSGYADVAEIKGAAEFVNVEVSPDSENACFFVPECEPVASVLIQDMKEHLDWLNMAASADAGRPNLNGIHVNADSGIVKLTATDGHRLGQVEAILEIDTPDCAVIVHRKVFATALKMVGRKGKLGIMHVGKRQVTFTGLPGVVFVNAMIDLEYPDVSKVMPREFMGEVMFNREQMQEFAVRVDKLARARKENPLVKININPEAETVEVYAHDCNKQRFNAVIDANIVNCDRPIEIAFNGKYMAEGCDGFDGEFVTLKIKGEASAALMTQAGIDAKYIIMPVRL